MPSRCSELKCRAYYLTAHEFRRLGHEMWSHGFQIKLGLRARALYMELYGKPPRRVRSNRIAHRNKVGKFPCGILEQAYRQLRAEGAT
jgi:hypothetical protein